MADQTPMWPAYELVVEDDDKLGQRCVTIATRHGPRRHLHVATAVLNLQLAQEAMDYVDYTIDEMTTALLADIDRCRSA